MTELDKKYSYEFATSQDLHGVTKLWSESSDWGELDVATLRKWIDAPYEKCEVAVVRDEEGVLLGMLYITPNRIKTPKGIVKAIRVSAPILGASLRGGNLLNPMNPVNKLFNFAFTEFAKRNYELVYVNPFASWERVLRISHNYGMPQFYIEKAGLIELDLQHAGFNNDGSGYSISEIDTFSQKHTEFWRSISSKANYEGSIDRNASWLNYKAGEFLKFEIKLEDKLVGMAIYDAKKQLLYDVTFENEVHLMPILSELQSHLSKRTTDSKPKIRLAGYHQIQQLIPAEWQKELDFTFAFALASLSPELSYTEIESMKWYITNLE